MKIRRKLGRVGRPRKQSEVKDMGSPLAMLRRLERLPPETPDRKINPAWAESALGVMLAHGTITDDEHRAGNLFAINRWKAFGRPFAKIGAYAQMVPGWDGMDESDSVKRARELYEMADSALKRAGSDIHRETWGVCVSQRLPPWFVRLKSPVIRPSDQRMRQCLSAGLAVLMVEFGIGRSLTGGARYGTR